MNCIEVQKMSWEERRAEFQNLAASQSLLFRAPFSACSTAPPICTGRSRTVFPDVTGLHLVSYLCLFCATESPQSRVVCTMNFHEFPCCAHWFELEAWQSDFQNKKTSEKMTTTTRMAHMASLRTFSPIDWRFHGKVS